MFKLDKLLAERKMTLAELAQALGCDIQVVSRIKNGRVRAFKIETLAALCEFFDCQPSDIMESVDEEEAVRRYGEQFARDQQEYLSRC